MINRYLRNGFSFYGVAEISTTILKRLDEFIARSTFFANFGLQNTLQPDIGVDE